MSNAQISSNKSVKLVADFKQIILELRAQNFDVIRFATYRTATKLRFIQKRLNLHLIDLWNVIEMFRDSNLHTLDIFSEIDSHRLEACIKNMYIQLNKRLAFNQQINVDMQTSLLLAWLLNLYDKSRLECVRVISFKVALTTLCAGKLIDKLKYVFTQISDQSKNILNVVKFDNYLKELLVLPKSVFEEPSFGYTENTAKSCFDLAQPVKLDDFLSVTMSDVAPACFIWLSIFHRFSIVQNITHPVTCSCCARSHFNGFRYKCQKCRKYQLCQDCFWRGRISHSHQLNHQMKEYTSYKSTAKQLSNTLRKSLFCKTNKQQLPIQLQPHQAHQQHHVSSKYKSINVQLDSLVNQSDYDLPIQRNNTTNESIVNANEHLNPQKPMSTNDILGTVATLHTSQLASSKKQVSSPTILNAQDGHLHAQDGADHQTTNQPQQFTNTQSLSFSHCKKPTQSYSNTLSMTRSKPSNNTNNEANKKDVNNLLSAFISSANSTNKANSDSEHALIASCCARLSEFYAKHPHMTASSPSNAKTTNHIQSAFGQVHSQQPPQPVSSLIEAYNAKFHQSNKKSNHTLDMNNNSAPGHGHVSFAPVGESQRTNSLTRHLWYNTDTIGRKYMNGGSTHTDHAALFSNSMTTNKTPSRSAVGKGGAQHQHGNMRSLSESNFRDNYDDDENDNEKETVAPLLDHHVLSVNQANAEFNSINERLLKEKREIVAKLEKQNREILKEIRRLKQKQQSNKSLDMENNCGAFDSTSTKHLSLKCQQQMLKNKELTDRKVSINPKLLAELMSLKERKGQLENRMQWLESSRDELVERLMQLDSLMKQQPQPQQQQSVNLLNSKAQFIPCDVVTNKYKYTPNNTKYPSTPTTTNNTGCGYVSQVSTSHATPLLSKASSNGQANGSTLRNVRSLSTPSSPALYDLYSRPLSFNASLNHPVQLATNCSVSLSRQSLLDASQRNLKEDLLIAADSVTNAMQNLVKELNTDNMSLNSLDEDVLLDEMNGHVEHVNGLSTVDYAELDNTSNTYAEMQLNGKHNGETSFKKITPNAVQLPFSTTPSLYTKDTNKFIKFTNAPQMTNGTANPISTNGTAKERPELVDDENFDDDEDNFGPEENFENYFLNNKTTLNNEFNYHQQVVKPSMNHHQLNNKKLLNDLKYFDFNGLTSTNREREEEEEGEEVAKSIDDQVAQWMRELEQRLDMNSLGTEQPPMGKENTTNLNDFDEEFTEEHQEQTTTTTRTTTTITTTKASLSNQT